MEMSIRNLRNDPAVAAGKMLRDIINNHPERQSSPSPLQWQPSWISYYNVFFHCTACHPDLNASFRLHKLFSSLFSFHYEEHMCITIHIGTCLEAIDL